MEFTEKEDIMPANVQKEKLIEMYKSMVRIRAFEERVAKEFAAGTIPGAAHLYSGQEAVAVGVCANLRTADYITSTHRGHGHLIAKGAKTHLMMAEIFGKKTGYNKGKGGSMHISAPELGIMGASGIVAGMVSIAAGAALSAQMRGTDQVAICFMGDGATNSGRFHESANLAACWNLPVIYIIENNLYGESTPLSAVCRLANLSDRAVAYGIPGMTIDGNDVMAVFKASGECINRARRGDGPSIVECKTYRYHGHFEGDPQTYKPKAEIEDWMKKDPIPRFRLVLIGMGILSQDFAESIDRELNMEIDQAIKFAVESPHPAPEETLEDVYA
jgi:TPP-dependent pyruvate/acetoin dehydrogenase alpha subunit